MVPRNAIHDVTPFDFANRVQILGDLRLVTGSDTPREAADVLGERVEEAAVLLDALEPLGRRGALGVAEQPLEHEPRIVLRWQRARRFLRLPGAGPWVCR
jgi:hypothetical protein